MGHILKKYAVLLEISSFGYVALWEMLSYEVCHCMGHGVLRAFCLRPYLPLDLYFFWVLWGGHIVLGLTVWGHFFPMGYIACGE